MPTYLSPEAGQIEAPDGYTASHWLIHRLAHQLHGERAIFRQLEIYPLDPSADTWTASAYIGAPIPGDGRLDYEGIYVYSLDAYLLDAAYSVTDNAPV